MPAEEEYQDQLEYLLELEKHGLKYGLKCLLLLCIHGK